MCYLGVALWCSGLGPEGESFSSLASAGRGTVVLCALPCLLQRFGLTSPAVVSLLLVVPTFALVNVTVVIVLSLPTRRGGIQ